MSTDFPQLASLLELAEAARICTDPKMSASLKSAADTLRWALKRLCDDPSADNLATVNGAWSHAARVYGAFKFPVPPAPVIGGLTEGALMQVAA